jgi:hypothetical protein
VVEKKPAEKPVVKAPEKIQEKIVKVEAPKPVIQKQETKVALASPTPLLKEVPAAGKTIIEQPISGSTFVQLGAFSSEEKALAAWKNINAKHSGAMNDASPRVKKVEIDGKGTFYRLQAGSWNAAAAMDVCTALKATGQACIIAK